MANVAAENHNIIEMLSIKAGDILRENYPMAMKRVRIEDVFCEFCHCGKNDMLKLRNFNNLLKERKKGDVLSEGFQIHGKQRNAV